MAQGSWIEKMRAELQAGPLKRKGAHLAFWETTLPQYRPKAQYMITISSLLYRSTGRPLRMTFDDFKQFIMPYERSYLQGVHGRSLQWLMYSCTVVYVKSND